MFARPATVVITLIASGTLLAACASTSIGRGAAVTGTATSSVPTTAPASRGPASTTPAASATTSPSASPSVTTRPAPSTPVREVTVTSVDGKRTYDVKIWWQLASTDCADHAYGVPVVQYLTANPCQGMSRLLSTTTVNGKAVGFAQTSLSFVGNAPQVYQTAGNFAQLERQDGTGSVNDLLREGYQLPSGPTRLPSPDAFDVESQDSGVTIVDAFYLSGSTPNNDPALVKMAQDIYLQF